jgi:hypothetical protein
MDKDGMYGNMAKILIENAYKMNKSITNGLKTSNEKGIKKMEVKAERTAPNRIVCASSFRFPRLLHPHSSPPQPYGLLYRQAGTSRTTGTLCAILP